MMPARKINPAIESTNLLINGPINNSIRWTLLPDANVLATIPGPIVVVPGDPVVDLGTFTLPSGVLPVGGAFLECDYDATAAGTNSWFTFTLQEAGGNIQANNSHTFFVTGVGQSVLSSFSLDLINWITQTTPDIGWSPGPMVVTVQAFCDAGDLLTVNSVNLHGRWFADLLAVGP